MLNCMVFWTFVNSHINDTNSINHTLCSSVRGCIYLYGDELLHQTGCEAALLLCLLIDEFSITCELNLCVGSRGLERTLCTSWCTVFLFTGEALLFILTKEYKKEYLALFIWFSLFLSPLLLKSLFLLEMCAEDAGHMVILSKKYNFGMW